MPESVNFYTTNFNLLVPIIEGERERQLVDSVNQCRIFAPAMIMAEICRSSAFQGGAYCRAETLGGAT